MLQRLPLLLDGGLEYSPKSGFLSPAKSSLFDVLERVDFQKESLVEAAGVEPFMSMKKRKVCVFERRKGPKCPQ
jgi:hypothetical protein